MANDPDTAPAARIATTTPIATLSVADAAEAHLRALLFGGAFEAGQELRDTVLARELGIARPTARTAVLRLISEGLLERRPGRSARVRTFTAADVKDSYDVRRLIEFEAVRIITQQSRSTTRIEEALADFKKAGDSWEAGPDADARFHTAVVAATGSPRLTRMFDALATEMRLMIGLLRSRYADLTELYDEHAVLLAALQSRDTGAALTLWEEHIRDAERYLTASLTEHE
ncbi:FCD domain-containing protein [Leifsonia shinshuensis]|uniref:DNA-binding GntR family transcriptional regulator n=1 Tax=Leifsonia shinshuensis TaxID=150026 RepID=A0A853D2Z0_9MICO|nr:DNA-binding GntR family transcriptional regulator [Leifsonia shinshuensis]